MKNILFLSLAFTLFSCAHSKHHHHKGKCCSKTTKSCKAHNKKCQGKTCKIHSDHHHDSTKN